jgi:hypothetical protein
VTQGRRVAPRRPCGIIIAGLAVALASAGPVRATPPPGPLRARQSASSIRREEGLLLVAMATCTTSACVRSEYAKVARRGSLTRLARSFNLIRTGDRSRAAACSLLRDMPRSGSQYDRLGLLGGFLYAGESVRQINATGQLFWHLSDYLAVAVARCPERLAAFIAYGRVAIRNHEDDYPDRVALVCRQNPKRFSMAFKSLPPADRRYVARYVIHPDGCRQIAVVAQ